MTDQDSANPTKSPYKINLAQSLGCNTSDEALYSRGSRAAFLLCLSDGLVNNNCGSLFGLFRHRVRRLCNVRDLAHGTARSGRIERKEE